MENKYKEGQEVFAVKDPSVKLIVRRYIDRIYYCRFPDEPDRKRISTL